MWIAQPAQPAVPTADQLRGLDPAVAITLLVVVALVVVLFYFGGTIRDLITRKPGDAAAPRTAAELAVSNPPPVATAVVDRAALVEDAFREHLLARITELEAEVADLRRALDKERQLREDDAARYRLHYHPPPGWRHDDPRG